MNMSHQNIMTRSVIKTTVSEILREDDKESDDDKPILKSTQSIYSNRGGSEFNRSSSKEKRQRRKELPQLQHFSNDDTDSDYVNDSSRFFHVPYKNKSVGTDNGDLSSHFHAHKAKLINNGYPYQSIPNGHMPYQSPYQQQMPSYDPYQASFQSPYQNCMPWTGDASNVSMNPFQATPFTGNQNIYSAHNHLQSGYPQTPLQNPFMHIHQPISTPVNNCSPCSYPTGFPPATCLPNNPNCYRNNGLYGTHYYRPGYGQNNRNPPPKKSCFKRFINIFVNNDNANNRGRPPPPKNVSFNMNAKNPNLARNYYMRSSPFYPGYSQSSYPAAQSPMYCQPMPMQQQQQQQQMYPQMHSGMHQTSQAFYAPPQPQQPRPAPQAPIFPSQNPLFNNFSPNANSVIQAACNKCNTPGNHGYGVHPQAFPMY